MSDFLLRGLDGGNLLGFLAAVGTLRAASAAWADRHVRMGWTRESGGWRPRLAIDGERLGEDDLLTGLDGQLKRMDGHPAFAFAQNLKVGVGDFRRELASAFDAARPDDRRFADYLAAFGSDAIADDEGTIEDTAFRTMSGAGHQHFLGFMRQIVGCTETPHLRAALLEPWRYLDGGPSMRWDPADDRRYALRWDEPSGDPVKTVRGANRLAIEALPLLPAMPAGRRLETTGFTQPRRRGVWLSWPIWEPLIAVDVARSLLSLGALQEEQPDRERLGAMGVREVFRCQRITQGKFRNFTPAVPV